MELLRESFSEALLEEVLEESTGEKKMYLTGIGLQGGIVNQNGRTYPVAVLEKAINEHVEKYLKNGRSLGELDHPSTDQSSINLENVSHRFVSITREGNNFVTKALVLETPKGKILKSLVEGGVKIGFSSRGLGNVAKDRVVQEYSIVSPSDAVYEPSAPDAFQTSIMENSQWVWDCGILIQKDLSESLDNYKVMLKEAKARDVQKVLRSIFKDYMNKLSS
jgi:predicted ester cyclase